MPPVDTSQFTEEQRLAFNTANALGSGVQTTTDLTKPITSQNLAPAGGGLNLPSVQQDTPQQLQQATSAIPSLDSILAQFQQTSAPEATQQDFRTRILDTLGELGGKQQATLEAEQEAGIPQLQTDLQELSGRLEQLQAEQMAIPLQIQEEFTGRGATQGGVEPIQTSRLRKNAIQALSVSAIARAKAGQLGLAQQQVDRSIELEFAPLERKLEFLQQAYQFNREDLERVDKKRADQLNIVLGERERLLAEEKAERKGVQNVLLTASQFDAPQGVLTEIANARSLEEAVILAGPYMQDPQAKAQLQKTLLDAQLTAERIKTEQYQRFLMQNPQESTDQLAVNDTVAQGLDGKINIMEAIKNSKALDSVVGTTFLSRSPTGFFGTLGAIASGVGIPSVLAGAVDTITGSRQNLIGNVEQLIDQEFLNKLIDVKSQGATFGALSNAEGQALRSAATKIGTWRIRKGGDPDGEVLGYNVSEKDFLAEIEKIQNLSKKAYEKATGNPWSVDGLSPDEQAFFAELQEIAGFNPTF